MYRVKLILIALIFSITFYLNIILPQKPVYATEPGITAWTVNGHVRVGQEDIPGSNTSIHLFAAKGEYEPFQVIIHANEGELTNVNFSVSDLTDADGNIIEKSNLTLYREHYVHLSKKSNDQLGANRPLPGTVFPDALIPFIDPATGLSPAEPGATIKAVPFDLSAGKNQPIWIDIYVPRDANAGDYAGTYTITSDQGEVTGQFQLTVWDFELPLAPSLKSCFLFWEEGRNKYSVEELMRHKIFPSSLSAFTKEDEAEFVEKFGLSLAGAGKWSGADVSTGTMLPAPSVIEFEEAKNRHLQQLEIYNYTADEISGIKQLYEPMKEWARNMHSAGIKNLVTMVPVPELYDDGTGQSTVDKWVLLPRQITENIYKVKNRIYFGDEVWSYNTLMQDAYSPKWFIDFDPINYRIQPGFISQSLGLTGLLYWRVDLWSDDPWHEVAPSGSFGPGEGMLFYPGNEVGTKGAVPSMRLKWLREGIEDYEYIQILKEHGNVARALEISKIAATDFKNWTRSLDDIENVRHLLAQEIINSEPLNMVKNPGFEKGTEGWNLTGNAKIVKDTINAGKGSCYLKSTSGMNYANSIITSGFEFGDTLSINALGKIEGNENTGILGIVAKDSNGLDIGDAIYIDITSNEWCKVAGEYVVPENTAQLELFIRIDSGTDSALYIDEISVINQKRIEPKPPLEEEPPPEPIIGPNAVKNGSFELGLDSNWFNVSPDGVEIVDDGLTSKEGIRCVKIGPTDSGVYKSLYQNITEYIRPGDNLMLSGWGRNEGSGTGVIGILAKNSDNITVGSNCMIAFRSPDWEEKLHEFEVPAGTEKIFVWIEGEGGTIYIDDVRLTKIDNVILEHIEITTPAAKLVYEVGEELDLTGIVVTGTYSDGITREFLITEENISGFDSSRPVDSQILTITIEGKTVTFHISVTTSINSLKSLVARYAENGDLCGALIKQLSNKLDQAEHHFNKERPKQAVKHLEDFIKHLNNEAMSPNVKENTKAILNSSANALIKIWLDEE